jgi:DNA-binding CsgD family transcriptional regulator
LVEILVETPSTPTIIWQIVAPSDLAQGQVEELLRSAGHLVIREGILPTSASLGVVRSAISITRREREVLEAPLSHDHTLEMSAALGISRPTVEWHMRNLMRQFEVGSRHRLVAKAILCGLLPASQNE